MALRVRLAESNKGSKERQGATLGVRFIEVSVKRESIVLIYLFIYLLNYLFLYFIHFFFFLTRPSFQSTENAEKSDVTLTYTLWKTFFFASPQIHDLCLQTTRSRAFSNEAPVFINPAQFDRIKSIRGKRGQGFTVFLYFLVG